MTEVTTTTTLTTNKNTMMISVNNEMIEKITKYYGYSYIIPCVCTFGIICNIMNLSVLASRRLKESPYTYLTALAYFDLLTLLFTLTTTFSRGSWSAQLFAADGVHVEFVLKKLERLFFLPSANLFSALSITVTVVLTIERYLFIKFPMHASSFCTPSNARRIVGILIVLVFAFRLPMYFFSDATIIDLNATTTTTTTKNTPTTTSSSNNNYHQLFSNESSNDRLEFEYADVAAAAAAAVTTTIAPVSGNVVSKRYRVTIVKKYEQYHKPYFLTSFLIFEIVPFILLFTFNLNLVLLVKSSTKELEHLEQEKSPQKTKYKDSCGGFSRASSPGGGGGGGGGGTGVVATTPLIETPVGKRSILDSSEIKRGGGGGGSRLNSVTSSVRSRPGGGGVGVSSSETTRSTTVLNLKSNGNRSVYDSKIEKRKRDQYKLTRTLITVVFFVLLSEISSIATYDTIAEYLVARRFQNIDYMNTYYRLQVFVSNLIVLVVHSVNFFLYCAFNKKYLIIFKQKYLFLFNLLGKLKCKRNNNRDMTNTNSTSLSNVNLNNANHRLIHLNHHLLNHHQNLGNHHNHHHHHQAV